MKFVLVFIAALFVTSFSVCASDLDQVDYYELDSVELSPMTASALDYGIALAAAADWSTTDSDNLANIENSLTNYSVNFTVAGMLYDILDYTEYLPNMNTQLNNIAGYLHGVSSNNLADDVYWIRRGISDLSSDTSELHNILTSIWGDTQNILTEATSIAIYGERQNTLTAAINNYLATKFNLSYYLSVDSSELIWRGTLKDFWGLESLHLTHDGYDSSLTRTLYSRIRQLQEVLASDDDLALANSQKSNREEIEDSFLNGSSGSTSLGASDFAELSDVGGSVKDMLSLDGNATVSSFVSGMTAADSAGSGWFSESTRSQLDAVSSPASTYSRSDPYNMSGWQDRYYWLIGDDENG